jgi:SNF2 family DNA or RNA helicase
MLLPRAREVPPRGHKALVFSQFTELLAIVREQLDEGGTPYEYLDGRTRDRAGARGALPGGPGRVPAVPDQPQGGGVGLNLTAAEYVFLLDPWWNPAVEAQAIDRAHRIGQTRRVFAYAADRARHGRGEGARAAGEQARRWPTRSQHVA